MTGSPLARARRHGRTLAAIRSFFTADGFQEVTTPLVSPSLLPEPAIEVFATQLHRPGAEPDQEVGAPLFLSPSPERHMRRLVALGSGPIFQLAPAFRNGAELDRTHSPEFTLLEWYFPGGEYLAEVERLQRLASALPAEAPLPVPFDRITARDAVLRAAGIDLDHVDDPGRFRRAAGAAGVRTAGDDTWEQIFNRIWLALVEPALPFDQGTVVYEYPRHVPTLAQPIAGTPYCRRWELYARGLEIANCFQEETDAGRLARVIDREAARKERTATVRHPPDRAMADEIRGGPAACAGVALGVERLMMALDRRDDISQVIAFPLHHARLEQHPCYGSAAGCGRVRPDGSRVT